MFELAHKLILVGVLGGIATALRLHDLSPGAIGMPLCSPPGEFNISTGVCDCKGGSIASKVEKMCVSK